MRCCIAWDCHERSAEIVFLDRDGTLNEETPDEQMDSLAKVRLMPGVVAGAARFAGAPDSASSSSAIRTDWARQACRASRLSSAHRFIMELFGSQGVEFEEVFFCPHFNMKDVAAANRKWGWCKNISPPTDRRTQLMMATETD